MFVFAPCGAASIRIEAFDLPRWTLTRAASEQRRRLELYSRLCGMAQLFTQPPPNQLANKFSCSLISLPASPLAIEDEKKLLEIDPNYYLAHTSLLDFYLTDRNWHEALVEEEEIAILDGRPEEGKAVERAFAASGGKGLLEHLIKRWSNPSVLADYSSTDVAGMYALLGDKSGAFRWLETAYQRPSDLLFLKVEPRFESLRSDPHFGDLLRRMRFPQ